MVPFVGMSDVVGAIRLWPAGLCPCNPHSSLFRVCLFAETLLRTPAVALSWLFSVRCASLVMRREGLRHDAVKDNYINVSRLHELDQVVN